MQPSIINCALLLQNAKARRPERDIQGTGLIPFLLGVAGVIVSAF